MNFHEKSAWACLVAILAVFLPYFLLVFQQPMAFAGLFILAVFLLVILLTVFHGVNALLTRSIRKTGDTPAQDELDRLIELRAAKLSGSVLATVVMAWSICAMFGVPALNIYELAGTSSADKGVSASQVVIPVLQALTAIQLLFVGFVLANLAYYGSIVAGYRRVAHG